MVRAIILLSAVLCCVWVATSSAQVRVAQLAVLCGPTGAMLTGLSRKNGEKATLRMFTKLQDGTTGTYEFWRNKKGAWSVLLLRGEHTCMIAGGERMKELGK